jgi:hypothetical protein
LTRIAKSIKTNLLHDSSLAFGKCNVSTRFIGNELDLDLSALATRLVIIVVVIVSSCRSLALDAPRLAISNGVVIKSGW